MTTRKDYASRAQGDRWVFTETMPAGCLEADTILWMEIKQFADSPEPGYGIASSANLQAEALTDTSARFTFRAVVTAEIAEGDVWHQIKMWTAARGVETVYHGRIRVTPWAGLTPTPPALAHVAGVAEFGFDTVGAFTLPPVPSAGPDASFDMLGAAPCQLAGSATGDGPITYLWSKVSGTPTVVFADATNPTTTATFNVDGAIVLRLTTSNSTGSRTDDVTITVTATLSALLTRMASSSRVAAWWEVGVSAETLNGSNFSQLNDVGAGGHHQVQATTSSQPSKVVGGGPNGKNCLTIQDSARYLLNSSIAVAAGKFLYIGGVFSLPSSGGPYVSLSGDNDDPASSTTLSHGFGRWTNWSTQSGNGAVQVNITSPAANTSWNRWDHRYASGVAPVTRINGTPVSPTFTFQTGPSAKVENFSLGRKGGSSVGSIYCAYMFELVTTTAGTACLSEVAAINYYLNKQTAL